MQSNLAGLLSIPWHAVRSYYASRRLYLAGHPILADAVASFNRVLTGVEIHLQADIGPGLIIAHGTGIVIGAAVLGERCAVYQNVTIGVADETNEARLIPLVTAYHTLGMTCGSTPGQSSSAPFTSVTGPSLELTRLYSPMSPQTRPLLGFQLVCWWHAPELSSPEKVQAIFNLVI
jgi:hypothetical protein